jgi:hypothetical protein
MILAPNESSSTSRIEKEQAKSGGPNVIYLCVCVKPKNFRSSRVALKCTIERKRDEANNNVY